MKSKIQFKPEKREAKYASSTAVTTEDKVELSIQDSDDIYDLEDLSGFIEFLESGILEDDGAPADSYRSNYA